MATEKKNAELARAEGDLAALRRAYERHWLGLERLEPLREKERLREQLVRLRTAAEAQKNLGLAFRARTVQASFLVFDELCNRRTREREEGRSSGPRGPKLSGEAPGSAPSLPAAASASVAGAGAPHAEGLAPTAIESALYAQLVVALDAHGKPAPSRSAFSQQLSRLLTTAQQRAPSTPLAPRLVVQPDGRVQLVVEPKSPAERNK